jgi:uroporphyrinogen-III decarboxylase
MTFRQRLLAVFAGQKPDAMPWYADLSYWYSAHRQIGDLPPQYEGEEGFIQMHTDHKVGYYLYGPAPFSMASDGVEVSSCADGDRTWITWKTPVGEMTGVQQYLPTTFSTAWVQWPCRTPEDVRVLRYIAESRRFEAVPGVWESYNEKVGERGLTPVLPPRSPVSAMLAEWTGATNLVYLLADAKEEMEKTLAAFAKSTMPVFPIIAQAGCPLVEYGDNLTGEIVTRLFERYQADFYRESIAILHDAGKKVGVHIDGTMHGIMPAVVETGMDFIESVTPKPVGDVEIEDLRSLAAEDTIFWGGIPGAMFAPPFTRDDIRRQVERVIDAHWEAGKFVLGSADQVPPNGDMELVTYVGELVEELC